MTRLTEIWIEHHAGQKPAIRLDWDNDYHHRVEIEGSNPIQVMNALRYLDGLIRESLHKEDI